MINKRRLQQTARVYRATAGSLQNGSEIDRPRPP
jgi:hypothetical protein